MLILGPQGAGKGTQAKRIAEEYEIPHIATGDLYRAAAAAGTDLGKVVGPLLDEGKLVPDEITIPLIREEVLKASGGFVLDGYPRNIAQAEALDELLDEIERPLSIVLLLQLDDAIARDRLTKRGELEGRADDTPDAIDRRLSDYHAKTEQVVDHYRLSGNLVQIHGERPIDEVWSEISDALEQVQARA
ncbi:MAG TPA: adenylate kinase [Gaiellaceae bacterium]